MTKEEELEKEVTEYLNTQTSPKMDSIVYQVIKNLIFGFALPREKRIAELEAKIEDLKSDHEYNLGLMKGLNEQIAKLEAQIEKMKFCENCMFENTPKVLLPCHICVAKSNWKPKEIKEK